MIELYTSNDFNTRKDIVRLIVDMEQVNDDGTFEVYQVGNQSSIPTLVGQPFFIHETIKNSIDQLKIVPNGFKLGLAVKEGEVLRVEEVPEEILLIRQKEQEIAELTQKIEIEQEGHEPV